MTYPNPFGMGGGGGFAVGPANNIFGATSGAADAIPLTVTPAANRAAAEAVRNAYATANPSWLSEYDGDTSIGIFLFWSSGGDNLMVGQTRIGGQWFDQVSITGVQGIPGSGTDFSNITPNHIPAIGAGPDFVPFDSGLRVIPNTLAAGAPGTVATPGSLQVGVATLRLEDQFEISGGGETLNFHAAARDQWFTPVMNQLTASGNARAIGIEQSAPITANIQPVFDTILNNPDFEITASGGGGLAAYDGEIVHAFFGKTQSAQSNIKLEFFLQGQTSPFWSQIYGTWPAGDFTIAVESPVGLYLGQTYRVKVSSTNGGTVQMLGNSAGVPFLSATLRPSLQVFMAQTNDFPWVDQVLTGDVAITATNWPDYKGVRFVNNSATNRTVTVTAAGMPALADLGFRVTGTGTITFTPADQIDGAASRVFAQGETNSVRYSGSTWNAEVRPLPGVNDITAGHRVNIDKSNPRNPTISTPTNTGIVLSANLTIDTSNSATFEEATIVFDNLTGTLGVTTNIADLPLGWSAWIGHSNSAATTGNFSVTVTGGTINGAASYTGQKNTSIRVAKTAATALTIQSFGGDLRPAFVSASIPTAGTLRLTGFNGTNTDLPVGSMGSAGYLYFFPDASSTLTAAQVKTALSTANAITDWNAQTLNTLTSDYATTAGTKFMWIAIPSDESILAAGVSQDSGATWTGVGPAFKFYVDKDGVNYRVYAALTSVAFTGSAYRFRFTTEQTVPNNVGGQPQVFTFTDSNGALTGAQVKALLPTAYYFNNWDAQTQNTYTDAIPTSLGSRFVYVVIQSSERISTYGISADGVTWTTLTPLLKTYVDYQGINYAVYSTASASTIGSLTYRLRFTTAAGLGVSYQAATPANQELLVGTGQQTLMTGSGITLVGGRIPNTSIGINAVQSSALLQLDDQNNWNTYRFRRIQFTGSGTSVRGIFTLPNLSAGVRTWLQVGDWIEVMNIGGTGNYNCQLATANTGQFLTGSLVGGNINIGVSTTAAYRITYTGDTTNWLVSTGVSGSSGEYVEPAPYTPWLPQDDGTGIYTGNDVEIRQGSQLLTQQYSNVASAVQNSVTDATFTFTSHVAAAVFLKDFTNDGAFPPVVINPSVPSMDATASLAYLDATALSVGYTGGYCVQPDGLGVIQQITYQSGTTMRAKVVIADSTNFIVNGTIRVFGAANSLNNGDFLITAITPQTGYIDVDYTNADASADLNVGDGTFNVAATAPVMRWRVISSTVGPSSWIARLSFFLNAGLTINAEIDPNWITPGAGHVSWFDSVYQEVVSGQGGNLHTDADIHAAGIVSGTNMRLAGRNLADATTPTTQGQSLVYNQSLARWDVGAPQINQLPVPTNLLPSGNDLKVLTYRGSGLQFDFPTLGGFGLPITSTLGAGDVGASLTWNGTGWDIGQPRVARLPVPQSALSSGNQWQVLTYDGTGLSMQFPRFAGFPVSRLDTVQQADGVRFDNALQSWVNSRTQGACFSRRQSVGQSVPSSTDVRVSFDTGDSAQGFNSGDVGLTYDSTTNIGRFTNTSGRRIMLQVNFQVAWSGGYTNGIRFAWIRWNGSLGNRIGYSAIGPVPVTNEITVNNGSGIVGLDANQFFEVWCYQSTGVTLTTGASGSGADAGYANRIQITRLNP